MLSNMNVTEILKYGLTGLSFLLAFFAYNLIRRATRANSSLVRYFLVFALAVAVINAAVQNFHLPTVTAVPKSNDSENSVDQLVDGEFTQRPAIADQNVLSSSEPEGISKSLHAAFAQLALSSGYIPRHAIRFVPDQDFYAPGVKSGDTLLGRKDAKYVFVADYDELKGLDINVALASVGFPGDTADVIAIVFDVARTSEADVRPGSVRGIFKAMRDLSKPEYLDAINANHEIAEDVLRTHQQKDYGLSNWRKLLPEYYRVLEKVNNLGSFHRDFSNMNFDEWRPQGFSTCKNGFMITVDEIQIPGYCGMVFLAKNIPVNHLKGAAVIRIHRSNPNATIPVVALN